MPQFSLEQWVQYGPGVVAVFVSIVALARQIRSEHVLRGRLYLEFIDDWNNHGENYVQLTFRVRNTGQMPVTIYRYSVEIPTQNLKLIKIPYFWDDPKPRAFAVGQNKPLVNIKPNCDPLLTDTFVVPDRGVNSFSTVRLSSEELPPTNLEVVVTLYSVDKTDQGRFRWLQRPTRKTVVVSHKLPHDQPTDRLYS